MYFPHTPTVLKDLLSDCKTKQPQQHMTELGVLVHPHSLLHQHGATVFAVLLCTVSKVGSICQAHRSLPTPPCTFCSRLRPKQLTFACSSWCVWLLQEQWLHSRATFTGHLLYTDTAWADLAALPLWCTASSRFSSAGKEKQLDEMPWPPQISCPLFGLHSSHLSLHACTLSLLNSHGPNAHLLYLPLSKPSPMASWSETKVHKFLHIFLCEDEITGFQFWIEHMINGQAWDKNTFFPTINFPSISERAAPSHTCLGGKLPRFHSKFQNQRTAKQL